MSRRATLPVFFGWFHYRKYILEVELWLIKKDKAPAEMVVIRTLSEGE